MRAHEGGVSVARRAHRAPCVPRPSTAHAGSLRAVSSGQRTVQINRIRNRLQDICVSQTLKQRVQRAPRPELI